MPNREPPGDQESPETDTEFVFADCVELCACCVCTVGIVVSLASIIYFLWDFFRTGEHSNGAHNYTALLAMSLTRSVNPCDNFYQFVCGGWIKHHGTGQPSLVDELEMRVFRDAAKRLDDVPVASRDDTKMAVVKAKLLFALCRNAQGKSHQDGEALGDFLTTRISFPDVRPMEADNIVALLIELSLSYKIHTLFTAELFADHDSNALPTVSLTPNNQLTEWLQMRNSFSSAKKLKDFMLAHIKVLPNFQSQSADALLEAIVEADATIIPQLISGYDVTGEVFQNLDKVIPGADGQVWVDAVNKQTVPYFTVKISDYVKIEHTQTFNRIGKLLANNRNDQKLLPTFIGWHLVRQLASRVSHEVAQMEFKSAQDHYDACFKETGELMPLAASRPFTTTSPSESTRQLAATIIEDVRGHIAEVFLMTAWFDKISRKKSKLKIYNMQVVLVEPDVAMKTTDLNAYYTNFTIEDSYFKTWLKASRAAGQRKMVSLEKGETFMTYEFLPIQVNAFYDRQFNAFFLPSGIIRPPYIDDTLPASFNYAGLGAVVGHETMHGFDIIGKDRDEFGKLASWWSPTVLQEYLQRVACLQKAYKSDPAFMTENVADFASLRAIYSAASNRSSAPDDMPKPEALAEFSLEQLFFINYCFKLCSRSTVAAEGYPTDQDRCNVALRNFRPFASAFRCQLWDKMNPAKRCGFWLPP
ncbi:membrane metallo-endopeptidase-like 1 [Ornithodoros turicata]|uniref:membrane metallo-endopeptidase-like 1 n=1 Tax=Ornithodoros turicata TaxID=34597 RepID=UPI003138BB50